MNNFKYAHEFSKDVLEEAGVRGDEILRHPKSYVLKSAKEWSLMDACLHPANDFEYRQAVLRTAGLIIGMAYN